MTTSSMLPVVPAGGLFSFPLRALAPGARRLVIAGNFSATAFLISSRLFAGGRERSAMVV